MDTTTNAPTNAPNDTARHDAARNDARRRARPRELMGGPFADAVNKLRQAEAQLHDAKLAIRLAKADVALAVKEVAASIRSRGADPTEVIRSLYWGHREINAGDIASAFHLSTRELAEVAGPYPETTTCYDCGQELTVLRESRSGPVRGKCDDCRAQDRDHELEQLQQQVQLLQLLQPSGSAPHRIVGDPYWDDVDHRAW